MNYKNERYHDDNLICLVMMLNVHQQLNLFSQAFDLPECGQLEHAARRQLFDVELTFANFSVVIETKVDSDENGREFDPLVPPEWQTTSIVENVENLPYLHQNCHFRFITYGTSEFYTKHGHENPLNDHHMGPFDNHFMHIDLNQMIEFVGAANGVLSPCNAREEWLNLMQIEQAKRNAAPELLVSFSQFRTRYLDIHHMENDFPRNRSLFCAPELAFPVMSLLAQEWNENVDCIGGFGKLALYPVGRYSPSIHDSILNFWNLRVQIDEERYLYFEINEDFNLNLKSGTPVEDTLERIYEVLNGVEWPGCMHGVARNYHQGAHVVYEVDFGFLVNADNTAQVLDNVVLTMNLLSDAFADSEFELEVE